MSDMFTSLVQAIQESVQANELLVSDAGYTTRPLYLPPIEPTVKPLTIHTLSGLVDYLKSDKDGIRDSASIHVVNPMRVEVIGSPQGRHKSRETYVVCDCSDIVGSGFTFRQFQTTEQFIINLQSQFLPSEMRDRILQVVGNIKEESVRQTNDDGVTQTVVAKAGIARVENVTVPSPVILKPYRTFREVEQPESSFVLRLQPGRNGDMPQCALFEADGKQWKLSAIDNIAQWLSGLLEDMPIIA
jgi:hypothetical protein